MKKFLAAVLVLLLLVSVTACGEEQDPVTEKAEPVVLTGDSYWVLEESEGDMRQYTPDGEDLLTDLTLWADGTARIREIEGGMWLLSGSDEQSMTWRCEEDGTLLLYASRDGDEPCWRGKVTEKGVELSRFGGTYRFTPAAMPEGGALYSPAELQGVWMIASGEIEGDEEDRTGEFNTLVFAMDGDEEEKTLVVTSEYGGGGYLIREDAFGAYQQKEVTVLDESIYSGCGNEIWSVRIGEESPLNEHQLPENTEIYATLLDCNTLLMQRYFSFDNGSIPGVSYQTYQRFLPQPSYDLEASDLEGTGFALTGYTTPEGELLSGPEGMTDFTLWMEPGFYSFSTAFDDGFTYTGGGGYWEMGTGGTLHMTSEASEEDRLCGAGEKVNGTVELHLWYEGGILHLTQTEEIGPTGYVDTMNDLEGNAFAAPENALFVLYNQDYTDMSALNAFPLYEVDTGGEAQYLLVTSVMDDSYFWLDEDGYCREDFGTVHAGESFVIRVNIPDSGGYLLQIECSAGEYYYELNQSSIDFYQNWNYLTT